MDGSSLFYKRLFAMLRGGRLHIFPAVGVIRIATAGISMLYSSADRRVRYTCIVAFVVVVTGMVVKSHTHTRNFTDDVCLFTHAVTRCEPRLDSQLHYLLATAYLTQDKNVVDALRHAKITADRTSYDAVNHANACTKYAGMKRYDKAFDECVKALRLEPSNLNFQRNLALLSIDAHQVENARQVIRELSGEVPVLHCLDAMVAYEVGVLFYGDALKACKPYMDKGFSLSR